jgi:ketosteroid isomerase-like protein
VSDKANEIHRIIESYQAAVFARDAEDFMRIYHPMVRVFDAWAVWSYEGAPAWRAAVEGWFSSLGTERVSASFSELQSTADHDVIVISAIVTYAAQSAQGEPLRSMQNRMTWVLRDSEHGFQIVHEHTSAPLAFDDAKAILTRSREVD